jgi:hypothetical protein
LELMPLGEEHHHVLRNRDVGKRLELLGDDVEPELEVRLVDVATRPQLRRERMRGSIPSRS